MNEEAEESASRKRGGNETVDTNTGMEDQPPYEDNDE